jgi:non-ribosomal peptide synthetase-like protein
MGMIVTDLQPDNAKREGSERAKEPVLLHEFFEKQVLLRPDHPAIEFGGQSVTYLQLDEQANAIANTLRGRGVKAETLVALYMPKSCRLFAALLGVLKAGAGYVPIDTKFPVERTRAILEDASVAIVISEGKSAQALAPHVAAEVVDLDRETLCASSSADLTVTGTSNDTCYVIYTSGSTGTPKGVVIEHRNAVNFVRAMHKVYGINERDRVYQGFSIAFDASVEETWAALSLGGTLVVPSEEVSRSTLDSAEFITSRQVTVFSTVPSFLALMKPDLPSVRVLILGGEACPPDLVSRWSRPNLRILNTYGPTEATVVATIADCLPNQPVTIGRAMPGYEVFVLDEKLLPVNTGESGELYIAGDSVARGYLNRSGLTAERFIRYPSVKDGETSKRLYRTFDLVRLGLDDCLEFIGRADGQVKIRGFRVELSEIECLLAEHPSIALAAAKVVDSAGSGEIAAYVVLAEGVVDLDREAVSALLRSRLPEYMVPKYLDILDVLPPATSGKLDRKALPAPQRLLSKSTEVVVLPESKLQRVIAAEWERALLVAPISIRADFFLDVGGHSLVAAKIVTALREKLAANQISVRDLYEHRTIEKLALHLESIGVTADNAAQANTITVPVALPRLPRTRWLYATFQLLGVIALYGVISAPFVFAVIIIQKAWGGEVDWVVAAQLATVIGFMVWPSWLALSIAIKWIVIGRYKAGRYPVWGFYYFRWWLVSRFQPLSWSQMFVGTPLMSLYYRSMGARIGMHCTIGSSLCTAFDLVEIGDNTSVGVDTHLLGYRVEDGYLVLGNVKIGRDCFVGTHCCLGLNVAMHDGAKLDDLSLLSDDMIIAEGEGRRGSPAEKAEVLVPAPHKKPWRGAGFVFGLIHLALIYAMGYVLIASSIPAIALMGYTLYVSGPLPAIAVSFAAVPVSILWYLQLVVLVKDLAIGKIHPRNYNVYSFGYLRYWFMNYLLNNTRQIVLPLYATVYLPRFLRHLGAKIGYRVEISTVMHAMPDLLEIDDESFLADACIVGSNRIYGGTLEVRSNKIGKRTFVGNSALVPSGINLGDNGLIGVMSTPPAGVDRTPDGTRWLGSPGFALPSTQQVSCFTAQQTFEPGRFAILRRALVELLRVMLPGFVIMASIDLFCVSIVTLYRSVPLLEAISVIPVIATLLSFMSIACVAYLKQIFVGQFVSTVKPLWSSYVWFNEVVNALYEAVAAPALTPLLGTPFASWFMRMLGCKIGRWVFLESTLFSEFDLVQIGDQAAINMGCTIQPHLFEDRVMKADSIVIGPGCSIGNMAVILYNTEMQARSSLGPLSVLMKGEGLPALSRWYGIPTQPVIDGDAYDRASDDIAPSLQPQMPAGLLEPVIPMEELDNSLLAAAPSH